MGVRRDKGSGSGNSEFQLTDRGPMGIIKMGWLNIVKEKWYQVNYNMMLEESPKTIIKWVVIVVDTQVSSHSLHMFFCIPSLLFLPLPSSSPSFFPLHPFCFDLYSHMSLKLHCQQPLPYWLTIYEALIPHLLTECQSHFTVILKSEGGCPFPSQSVEWGIKGCRS